MTMPQSVAGHGRDYAFSTDKIADIVLARRFGWRWWSSSVMALLLVVMLLIASGYLFFEGPGVWGINIPVAWGYAITNYVWWIDITMGSAFISAALLLARQPWGAAIGRTAESMTLAAGAAAGVFPILHLGRAYFFYWLLPYPDSMNLWPQWRSSLVWDFYGLASFLAVAILFFYVRLLPDLATLRDRARHPWVKVLYGLIALGWRGEARDWSRHARLVLILAGVLLVLVVFGHSMVAFDFSEALLPGWHSTLFPPYFVTGAVDSGVCALLCVLIPMRRNFDIKDFITSYHLDNLAKLALMMCQFITYEYLAEIFTSYYSGDVYEIALIEHRFFGLYSPLYWIAIACISIVPQLLWFPALRRRPLPLFVIAALVVAGMWVERFMLIVTSLYQGFLPSDWGYFIPTEWDWIHLIGSMGIFAFMFLLFIRLLPAISISDMRRVPSAEKLQS